MASTIEDVAQVAQVSTATVSRVLNQPHLVSIQTRRRVLDAMQLLDYKVNLAGRHLRTNRTRTAALLLPGLGSSVISRLVEGVEDAALAAKYALIMFSTRHDADREAAYIDLITRHRLVDGVLCVSPCSSLENMHCLENDGIPLVMCNGKLDGVASVLVNYSDLTYQATEYLLAWGHQRILLLNWTVPSGEVPVTLHTITHMRQGGFRQALAATQAVPQTLVVDDNTEWQAHLAHMLRSTDRPTAIIACCDKLALAVYAVCRGVGLRIPHDLSVIGCDDILVAQYVDPPLTTIRVPAYKQGRLAMESLLQAMMGDAPEEPAVHLLKGELVLRDSCAPPQQL
ncbi:MAG: LacI family transcriptional regulator [Chloroflexi bacterium]|nr:LacI family transcriptional regulator [Chloroflexota bacterium]